MTTETPIDAGIYRSASRVWKTDTSVATSVYPTGDYWQYPYPSQWVYPYYTYPQQHREKCPSCGYCPCCGRKDED